MASTPLNRVLLLSASAGAGHARAAEALKRAFEIAGAAREVVHLDILKHATGLMRGLYAKTYFRLARAAPELLGWAYRRSDRPWKYVRRRTAFDRLNLTRMTRAVLRLRPDLVICTHFTPAEVVSWLKAKGRLACPQAIVVTDLDAHGMWLVPTYDRYFVAIEETKAYLATQGVPERKIGVTGIPIDPVFSQPKDRDRMRRKHGLPAGAPVVLVAAGGGGVGPMEELLSGLTAMRSPATVVALTGRNDGLRRRLKPFERLRTGGARFRVLGFTTEIDEWMAAADVLLGKPGGLTMAEALARGVLFAVANPIPGQEERNADHLLEEGAAIRCNNLPVLAWKLDRLLGDARRMAAMRRAALRMARPRAAFEIVRQSVTLAR